MGRQSNCSHMPGLVPRGTLRCTAVVLMHVHRSQYNPIWEFGYTINGQQCDMLFTSVAGHLMELEFAGQYKRWRGCSPLELYTAPVVKDVPQVCGLVQPDNQPCAVRRQAVVNREQQDFMQPTRTHLHYTSASQVVHASSTQ